MVAAVTPIRMAMLLPLLAVAALSQAGANEPVAVETALVSDDQCAAGDAACALNALQRRGAALSPDAEEPSLLSEKVEDGASGEKSSRRRRAPQVPDLTLEGEKKFTLEIQKTAENIKKLEQELIDLEENVNITWRMANGDITATDDGKNSSSSSRRSGSADGSKDEGEDEGDEEEPTWLEVDSQKDSRRRKAPPRQMRIQHMVDQCQAVMNKFWKRSTRLDRLCEWCKSKIQNPGTPEWQEPTDLDDDDDDDDDKKSKTDTKDEEESLVETGEDSRRRRHSLQNKEVNPEDANMQKIVDDLVREVENADKELIRIGKNADVARNMAKQNLPGGA